MMPAGIPMVLIENAIQRITSTVCLNPDRIRSNLRALEISLGTRADQLAAMEMELMRLSNVSSERFLTDFLGAADRMFSSSIRRSWIPSALFFLQPLREQLGTGPAPARMPPPVFRCLNAFRILVALVEIERHLRMMDAIYNQMEPAYLAGSQRLQAVIGPTVLSAPPGDPGRGARMLSAAEQVAFATVRALRQEVNTMLGLVREALGQFFTVLPPSFQRLSQPMG